MTARLRIAHALGGARVDVGMRERLLVLRNGRSKERRIPFEGLLPERNLVDPATK